MKKVPVWKRVLAFVIDFVAVYLIFGFIIGYFTDQLITDGIGFDLEGGSAILFFVLIIAYFIIMNKWCGGTIAKKLLGISKKKSK